MTVTGRLGDTLLAVAATGFATLFLWAALAWELPQGPDVRTLVVAKLDAVQGAVQVRPSQRLGWRALERGDDVRDRDAIFVAPGSAARVAFSDGTVLELDEKSLVVIESRRAGAREVTLKQGSVSGTAGDTSLVLLTPQGSASLGPRTEAHVELTGEKLGVAVTKGQAQVSSAKGSRTLASGERANSSSAGVSALPAWPVTLLTPGANERRRASANPEPVVVTVSGKVPDRAKVEFAKDRLFAFVVDSEELTAQGARLEHPSAGVTWWRVVDAAGQPLSESRRFALVDEAPPQPMAPKEGEVVLAPEGTAVAFSWTPMVGVTRYRFEVSSSRGFEPIVASEVATGSTLKWTPQLAEGAWFWRVAAVDGALGEGVPCEPLKFRLIKKALPSAPELLSPEVEIAP